MESALQAMSCWASLAGRPSLSDTVRASVPHMLLSFERPAAGRPLCRAPFCGPRAVRPRQARGAPSSRTLKTAQLANESRVEALDSSGYHRALEGTPAAFRGGPPVRSSDHRQDIKGTRWMPWHQESMKGVDGCDKPR